MKNPKTLLDKFKDANRKLHVLAETGDFSEKQVARFDADLFALAGIGLSAYPGKA